MKRDGGIGGMTMTKDQYNVFIGILKEELLPALGCTEPIAIAYAAAKCREVLGNFPEKVIVRCSGNIIKNAKSVFVPNTGNLKGIRASALAGIVAGDPSKELQVLEIVSAKDIKRINEFLKTDLCEIKMIENVANLHIIMEMFYKEESALVEIIHTHTNISRICKNNQVIFEIPYNEDASPLLDRGELTVKDIFEFANSIELKDIEDILEKQVSYNLKIAEEGLISNYGVNIGKMLLECYGNDVLTKMRAYAAAGSDARMGGCSLPVVTNSGSGNQGMTSSLPVIVYSLEKGMVKEKMYRALVLANLMTIHLKTGIGRLSAYCGVVSAACGSGTGITYLEGGDLKKIERTITNTLANVSGIVCDGAKASCAAKIASSLDAAMMAHFLAMKDLSFEADTGIVKNTIEETISAVGRLGREGMKHTDLEVLKIMLDQ